MSDYANAFGLGGPFGSMVTPGAASTSHSSDSTQSNQIANLNADLPSSVASETAAKAAKTVEVGEDGQIIYQGQPASFFQVFADLTGKKLDAVDGLLADMLNNMQDSNKDSEEASKLLDVLRIYRPENGTDTVKKSDLDQSIKAIQKEYEGNSGTLAITEKLGIRELYNKTTFNQNDVDQIIDTVKEHISNLNSNRQMEQIQLEKYNNMRNQTYQTMSSLVSSYATALKRLADHVS